MSVINQMLKDLDQRQQQPNSELPRAIMAAKKSPSNLIWFGLFAILIIVLASLYFWPKQMSPSIIENQPLSAQTEQAVTPLVDKQAVAKINAELPELSVEDSITVSTSSAEATETAANDNSQQISNKIEQNQAPQLKSEVAKQISQMKTTVEKSTQSEIEESVIPQTEQPRVVKVSPQQVQRDNAQKQFNDLIAKYGNPTAQQLEPVLAIDETYHKARIQQLTWLSQHSDTNFVTKAQQAIANWPEVFQYRQLLARHIVMKQPKEAYRVLTERLPTIEQSPDYHGLIAYSAKQMGDLPLASKQYQLLLRSYPERSDWWLALALSEDQMGNQSMALSSFEQSLRFPGLATNVRSYAEQRIKALQGF